MTASKTLRLKVKPDAWAWLDQAAREVNAVWNFANETTGKAAAPYSGKRKFLTGYDVMALAAGASSYFDRISADTIQAVIAQHAVSRRSARRARLRWRASGGSGKSLGWVPFKAAGIKRRGNSLRYFGKTIRVFESERLATARLRAGQFAQNALGEWFVCITVDVASAAPAPRAAVGIDLGLKAVATTSDGDTLPAIYAYRSLSERIAQAQRRGHKRQAKRLHAKAANRRRDAIHKFTSGIVRNYQHIVIGDVSARKLARLSFGKAVNDSGWGILKTQLLYKGQWAGRSVQVVGEAYTTRACSACGALTGPAGRTGLAVREWTCADCGAAHDRDVNAARNILALSQRGPFAGSRGAKASPRLAAIEGCEVNQESKK